MKFSRTNISSMPVETAPALKDLNGGTPSPNIKRRSGASIGAALIDSPDETIEAGALIVKLLLEVLSALERPIKALSDDDVAEIMGISRSAVWALCSPDSASYDERFPKPKKCKTLRRTIWNSNQLQKYLEDLFSEAESPTRATRVEKPMADSMKEVRTSSPAVSRNVHR